MSVSTIPTRAGIANLPLHYGKVPPWLFGRMVKLAREIIISIVTGFGAEELLKRMSYPYWFQDFGCLLGYDWHSSSVTTTLCGDLKEGIPYPFDRKTYDQSIELLKRAINKTKLGLAEKKEALNRLKN